MRRKDQWIKKNSKQKKATNTTLNPFKMDQFDIRGRKK
ncbi:hypothetical protein SAMN05444395_10332 [Flavobacterium fryxellicola]|nr:hypothetical protein SAMN05444395_10332 [Flavobacterium fryxellicola]